ncbi:MAG: hypothetical protein D6778_03990 [Nitrospirae bacterium]|nr:MAG: hypothetical protein D6778_03990 [Nitrospirota bacterium]
MGPLLSATELYSQTKGLNLRGLVRAVEDKPGLKKKAESLVVQALSARKNWENFERELFSFAKSLYWSDRQAFSQYLGFIIPFMVYSINALKEAKKPLTDLEELLELVSETDDPSLASKTLTLLEENLKEQEITVSQRFVPLMKVLIKLSDIGNDSKAGPWFSLIKNLRRELDLYRAVPETILKELNFPESLRPYTEAFLQNQSKLVDELQKALQKDQKHRAIETLEKLNLHFLDQRNLIKDCFTFIKKNPFPPETLKITIETITGLIQENPEAIPLMAEELLYLVLSEETGFSIKEMLSYLKDLDRKTKAGILFRDNLLERVFNEQSRDTEQTYLSTVSTLRCPPSQFRGYDRDTWEPEYNPQHTDHLKNLFKVLSFGGYRHKWFLYRAVATLYITDLFIPDDAIFQRHITNYLNSVDLKESLLEHLVLLRRLPVYYNEIGATGTIRDLSTRLDSWGNDPVLYFLRKQVHVNSGPHNLNLTEAVIRAWATGSRKPLSGLVPEDLLFELSDETLNHISEAMALLLQKLSLKEPLEVIQKNEPELKKTLDEMSLTDEMRGKLYCLFGLYRELKRKYTHRDTQKNMENITLVINKMKAQKDVFTSPEKTSPQEDLYHKRHIAFGIPSVLGTYREKKFDALCEFFKEEENLSGLLEETIQKKTASITETLKLFNEVFSLYGLRTPTLRDNISVLENYKGLYLSQMVDLFKLVQKELITIVEGFYRQYLSFIDELLKDTPEEHLAGYLRDSLRTGTPKEDLSDLVMRNILALQPGILQFDRFLNETLRSMLEELEKGGDRPFSERPEINTDAYIVLSRVTGDEAGALWPSLGTKAKNLIILKNKGLPVPEGVILPSEWTFSVPSSLKELLREAIGELERATGKLFGHPERPLLLSVRSGSYVSMPGILDSILFCGINKTVMMGISKEYGDTVAWDCYQRFLSHYLSVVHGLRVKVEGKTPEELAQGYLDLAKDRGIIVPEEPFEQLYQSVIGVWRSWSSEKAISYRRVMNISEHWGTAVILMPMVIANAPGSGASVFFTRDPRSFEVVPYGDTLFNSTGDDIVSGRKTPIKISKSQTTEQEESLEDIEPALYRAHCKIARAIEQIMDGFPQEVELAYKRKGTAWHLTILQTRNLEFSRTLIDRFHESCRMASNILTRGVGVNGGALSGLATFETRPDRLKRLKETLNMPLILFRTQTSTEDAHLMRYVDGLVTTTGGVTSHASILAKKFGITAVVGCGELKIMEHEHRAVVGDFVIEEGSPVSIDGATGLLYRGTCPLLVKER